VRNQLRIVIVAAAALAAVGCLQKKEIHTLYLSPDGSAVWSALERDVYSDDEKAAVRVAEETAYLEAARRGEHDLARELAALGSTSVRSRILRSDRPFAVWTTAGYTDIGVLFDRILSESGTPGYARLARDGSRTTLTIHMVLEPDEMSTGSMAAGDLLGGLEGLAIVLTDGRFVSATGFTIADGGRAAKIGEEAAAEAEAGVLDLRLTWEVPRY
jgi:hypothetical protein